MLSEPSYGVDHGRALSIESARCGWFVVALLLVAVVMDGWSGKPSPLVHQVLLLPVTAGFTFALWKLLGPPGANDAWNVPRALLLAAGFVFLNLFVLGYERKHFAAFGYSVSPVGALVATVPFAVLLVWLALRGPLRAAVVFSSVMVAAAANFCLAIVHFPLDYLRSDMLPVILWADTNLLRGVSPYQTMYVGGRVYDFPYLPGVLLAYLPAVALHVDLRFETLACLLLMAAVAYFAARPERRMAVAALLGLLLLDPFLQYRHELYLEPHWLLLMGAFVLMSGRRYLVAALVFGLSMALYQFSWIMFPFVLLFALRREGWAQVAKEAAAGVVGAMLLVGPFLRTAAAHISNNTVGQWGGLRRHAQAEPMNLSYWVTYVVPTSQLLKLQAVVMIVLFGWCLFRGRCRTLEDMLRWIVVAVALFIALNVLVDGYFYLMLLVPMFAFVCVANGWWGPPGYFL